MPLNTRQKQIFDQGTNPKDTIDTITIGTVVDTNDPQQMGRIRIVCPQWGDSMQTPVENLPWAVYLTPFGGQMSVGTRGPGIQESQGGIAYGMWAIPKIGAQVAVMCVDGDPMLRLYIGCIFDQFTPHTLPHGRWMYDDHPELEKKQVSPQPFGPYTSREHVIQPLSDNLTEAFGNKNEPNYEWRTRAADYTASGLSVDNINATYSKVPDDTSISHDGWSSTQGYQVNRLDPHADSSFTAKNYDSQVYSMTSPGFHSISMDDRQENCRMRMRTTAGHQIIMDDTNERIYIATAKGNNWIEMDQDGNIDIFTSNKVSVHAKKDINLNSDQTIRLQGKEGIHMFSEGEIRMHSSKDMHIKTDTNLKIHSSQNTFLQSDLNTHIKTGQTLYVTAAQDANIISQTDLKLTSSSSIVHISAASSILGTATEIHMNGPEATPATEANPADEQKAFWTSKVPQHEPYGRCMTKHDFTNEPEFSYTDINVNRVERGRKIIRGMYWRR